MILLLIVLPGVFALIAWGTYEGTRRYRASLRYGAAIAVFALLSAITVWLLSGIEDRPLPGSETVHAAPNTPS